MNASILKSVSTWKVEVLGSESKGYFVWAIDPIGDNSVCFNPLNAKGFFAPYTSYNTAQSKANYIISKAN
jgi:hypothetical protein